ncbi:hypothetical protein BDN70DRAFT_871635 [Pholiota conissans]|uniref:Uncharacterized protein n=1 Tax=Pholiota conissans TaxID=109636 RepID=A0A9P6D6T9_9AGAR|nr:hypothetical protein BDN70DRAFT_871635 [Pholiota conissans]
MKPVVISSMRKAHYYSVKFICDTAKCCCSIAVYEDFLYHLLFAYTSRDRVRHDGDGTRRRMGEVWRDSSG